ncbi:uncharacterized protein LOC124649493 isoform X4 [Lolium rigidum]|uniref:uncharacterized protein LOC124649493 isoform X4 n=1 Tax=Lolium rigidum TaxID=89674 RepID=UPI001F5DE1AB|nr:uncharacterized protein LOC124649493 isoform X4 [Lolium rigidum]
MLATAACRWSAPALPAARPGGGYLLGRVRISKRRAPTSRRSAVVRCGLLPVDPWAPTMDSQSIASQLFAVSLFPYLGFLYFMTRSKTAPGLTLFGFYFLLAFVGATSLLSPEQYLLGYMPKFTMGPLFLMWTCYTGRRNRYLRSPICSSCWG